MLGKWKYLPPPWRPSFSKVALTGQRIANGRYGFASFLSAFPYLPWCRWRQRFTLKIFFSCSLGGGFGLSPRTCSQVELQLCGQRQHTWEGASGSSPLRGKFSLISPELPKIKNKKSAQRGSFWDGHPADIRGSFARTSRPKTSVRALKILEKQGFGRGHP